jgi:Transposase IS116/IS110/IS902 family
VHSSINPVTLARYREAFTTSRAKDDPTDADFLCELVALHREQLQAQHPDASLFAALPGSGTAYSARLLAAFGSRRELFQSAEAMLNFSGIAPVLKRSVQATITHRRYARPRFLHQSSIEYANESAQPA